MKESNNRKLKEKNEKKNSIKNCKEIKRFKRSQKKKKNVRESFKRFGCILKKRVKTKFKLN